MTTAFGTVRTFPAVEHCSLRVFVARSSEDYRTGDDCCDSRIERTASRRQLKGRKRKLIRKAFSLVEGLIVLPFVAPTPAKVLRSIYSY